MNTGGCIGLLIGILECKAEIISSAHNLTPFLICGLYHLMIVDIVQLLGALSNQIHVSSGFKITKLPEQLNGKREKSTENLWIIELECNF